MTATRRLVVLMVGLALAACAQQPVLDGTGAQQPTTPSPSTTSKSATPPPATPISSATTSAGPVATPTATPTVPVVPPELLGKVWTVIPTSRKRVALTFDCGGNADGLPSILATLAAKRVHRATFFMTGNWARVFPDEAAQLGTLGVVIGNHTDRHLDLTDLDATGVRREVRQGRLVVRRATGVEPKPWFRFPFGAYDSRTLGIVADTKWVALGWTVDTLGWKGTSGGQSAESVLQRVLDGLTPGEIVLMHVGSNPDDGSTLDADALASIIDAIRAEGYRFFTPQAML